MVRLLKSRIEDILENKNDLIILEPSAGEGAFIKEIIEHPCFSQKWHIDAVDIDHRAISLLQKVTHTFIVIMKTLLIIR